MATYHVHVCTTAVTRVLTGCFWRKNERRTTVPLRGTDVRVTYQYHVDGALSHFFFFFFFFFGGGKGPPQWVPSRK